MKVDEPFDPERELDTLRVDSNYKLYVAELSDSGSALGEIVGFCRFYDSAGLPAERKKFPSPEGWYGMGILVKPTHRRNGIARFLPNLASGSGFAVRSDSFRQNACAVVVL